MSNPTPRVPFSPLDEAISHLIYLIGPYTQRLHSLSHSRLLPPPKPDAPGSPLASSISSTSDLPTLIAVPPSPFFTALAQPMPLVGAEEPSHSSAPLFCVSLASIIDLPESERQFAVAALLKASKEIGGRKGGEIEDAAFFVPGKIRFDSKRKGKEVAPRDERDYVEGTRALELVADLIRSVLGPERMRKADQNIHGPGHLDEDEDEADEELARKARKGSWTAEWKRRGVAKAEERVRDAVLECVIRWKEEKTRPSSPPSPMMVEETMTLD